MTAQLTVKLDFVHFEIGASADLKMDKVELRYGYNLAGNLTSLTDDRFGTNVTYNRNKAGELVSVIGSGYPTTHVPPQFTDPNNPIKYRAWGAMKRLTYGNNYSNLTINYDSRLQITQFGGAHELIQYYDDGRIRFIKALPDPSAFDRSYEYDHMGRLAQALTGAEARGESPADGPYKQTYQRDVWGHLIERPINQVWGHDNSLPAQTYVNDRNQNWTYDVAGNVIQGAEGGSSYDAAGRKTSTTNPVISLSYDGDGRFMRRVEFHDWPIYNRTTYFIRSSVLGGMVVTEVSSSGEKQQAYVYANGNLLMKQSPPDLLHWEEQSPITGFFTEFVVGNTFGGGDYDPMGAKAYGADPYESNPDPTYENTDGDRPLYYDDGNPFRSEGGCTLDGVPVSCDFLLRKIDNGAVQAQTPRGIPGDVIHLGGGRIAGRYGTGSHLDDEGDRVTDYQYFYGSFAFGLQADQGWRNELNAISNAADDPTIRQAAEGFYNQWDKCREAIQAALHRMNPFNTQQLRDILNKAKFIDVTKNEAVGNVPTFFASAGEEERPKPGQLAGPPVRVTLANYGGYAFTNSDLGGGAVFFGEEYARSTDNEKIIVAAHEVLHLAFGRGGHGRIADILGLRYDKGDFITTQENSKKAIDTWLNSGCESYGVRSLGQSVDPIRHR